MVQIIGPDAIQPQACLGSRAQQARLVALVLGDDEHPAARRSGSGPLADLQQQVRRAVVASIVIAIHDGVGRIQAQAVRMVVADPHLHVGEHHLAHGG